MTTRWKRYGTIIGIFLLFVMGFFGTLVWNAVGRLQRGEIDLSKYSRPSDVTRSINGTASAVQKVDRALVESADDPSLGPADAKVTIVEFSEFQCPFSQEAFPIIKQVIAKYGDKVRFVFRDFPLSSIHPEAQAAAEAASCANEQNKFWALHDLFFLNQADLSGTALTAYATQARVDPVAFGACRQTTKYLSEVQRDVVDGVAAGVTGTPTFFVNGWRLEGVLSMDAWEKIIDYGLKKQL